MLQAIMRFTVINGNEFAEYRGFLNKDPLQKQLSPDIFQNSCSEKFEKFSGKYL